MTYHPSEVVRERVVDFIQQSKNEELPAAETAALAHYRQREHLAGKGLSALGRVSATQPASAP